SFRCRASSEGIARRLKVNAVLAHTVRKPVMLIEANTSGERKIRTDRSSRERRAPALWRGGEVQLDRLAAGARARLNGELSGAGLEEQRRGLLGAVDAHPGAEHPAARAAATRLVRCQSEALAHHASDAGSGAAPSQSESDYRTWRRAPAAQKGLACGRSSSGGLE